MIKKINIFPLIGKFYNNKCKVSFTSLQLLNKNFDTNNILSFKTTLHVNEGNMKNMLSDKNFCIPLTNCIIYDKKDIYSEIKSKNIIKRNSTENMKLNTPCNLVNKENSRILSFSWLKNVRKKQYYNIIGKIGIKKRNAGMYWSFYVNKRKKIRKKRRTI
ncbi:conserved Plasmodium protein, unknown function [Plasmodium gallinaceum]|uniref:Uncharacterized protein n=1 Tax=Plasmodium gallinaceum TaxID=5849 RepID=A0A1J1GQ48_PLAGA|nr:conserved Plasmodium protein, unknown function [Plasmodium gallinaceum]CRG94645.1 conserved Plasmodium protein, unknown function [Plasmodium gallinaceum]